ncbi:unnamed protein product [Lampetra fluviatilis]
MRRGFSLRLKPAAELAWRPLRQRRRRRRRCRVRGGAVVAVAAARSLPVVSLSPRDAKSRRRQLTRLVPGRSWPRPRMGEGRLTRRRPTYRRVADIRATGPLDPSTLPSPQAPLSRAAPRYERLRPSPESRRHRQLRIVTKRWKFEPPRLRLKICVAICVGGGRGKGREIGGGGSGPYGRPICWGFERRALAPAASLFEVRLRLAVPPRTRDPRDGSAQFLHREATPLLAARGAGDEGQQQQQQSAIYNQRPVCDASGTALKTTAEYTGVGAVHRDESTAGECEDCEAPELK